MNNITIIGTSHIAKQSLLEVKKTIEELQPDIVAVELDKKRLPALFAEQRKGVRFSDMWLVGIKGFLFAALASWAEAKLGEAVGVKPGAEMKQAIVIGRKQKAQIALIDQDIEVTLKRLSVTLTWKEKWNFIADVIKSLVSKKPEFSFDLRKVPEEKLIATMLQRVRVRYPQVYTVLITERNEVMAKNIVRLAQEHPEKKMVVVVGAGHKEGLEQLLEAQEEVSISYHLPKGMSVEF